MTRVFISLPPTHARTQWNPATADYLPVCLYNVDLCTLGFMDMLNSSECSNGIR